MPRIKSSKRINGVHPPVILSRFPGQLRSEQLREYLVRKIAALATGDKLPSERDLAKDSGLSLLTVNKVLAMLAAEGFVERRTGRGTFISNSPRMASARGALKMLRFVTRRPEETLARATEHYIALYYRGVREAAAADGIEVLPTGFELDAATSNPFPRMASTAPTSKACSSSKAERPITAASGAFLKKAAASSRSTLPRRKRA